MSTFLNQNILLAPGADGAIATAGNFGFDPCYGMDLAALLAVEAEVAPADFADFWDREYGLARQHEPSFEWRGEAIDIGKGLMRRELRYRSTDGTRIGAWLLYPRDEHPRHLELVGHGYGGRASPPQELDGEPTGPVAALYPCIRGMGALSLSDTFPDNAQLHVVCGIESVDSYVIRGCVHDLWAAATVLQHLYGAGLPLIFRGGSFGGGLGALMLACDSRFTAAVLRDPTFGHQSYRVSVPCLGSGKAVRERYLQQPQILDVLRYYDSAAAARRMRQPTFFICSRLDPKVPPPGQFAVWQAHPGPKRLYVKPTGHCPQSDRETRAANPDAATFLLQHGMPG